jgi:hypothetical protein
MAIAFLTVYPLPATIRYMDYIKSCYEERSQKKILTVSLFYLDLEVVLHKNDVTLDSSINKTDFSVLSTNIGGDSFMSSFPY